MCIDIQKKQWFCNEFSYLMIITHMRYVSVDHPVANWVAHRRIWKPVPTDWSRKMELPETVEPQSEEVHSD